jgi:hypothetical protein
MRYLPIQVPGRRGAGGFADGDPGAARHQGRRARIRRLEQRAGGTAARGEGAAAVPPARGRAVSVRVRSVHARSFPLPAAGGKRRPALVMSTCRTSRCSFLTRDRVVAGWFSGPMGAHGVLLRRDAAVRLIPPRPLLLCVGERKRIAATVRWPGVSGCDYPCLALAVLAGPCARHVWHRMEGQGFNSHPIMTGRSSCRSTRRCSAGRYSAA